MAVPIRVLGSDISHHNRTVLRLFNGSLTAMSEHARTSMVAGQDAGLSESCPTLSLNFYSGKKALADAVIAKAKADRQQRFFFHGQFSTNLWLALLNGGIRPAQFYWYIWDADLYEVPSGPKLRLSYSIRRTARNRVGCVSAIRGSLRYFVEQRPRVRGELLYFPTRTDPSLNNMSNNCQRSGEMTVMAGNSGGRSSEYVTTLRAVHQQLDDTVNVIVPMGYPANNAAYIDEVRQAGLALFSVNDLQVLDEKLEFDVYLALSRQCDLGYSIFARRQRIGTLCLLIQTGTPRVLNYDNPSWQGMVEQNLPVLFTIDDLNEGVVHETQRQLASVDRNTITSFSPNYLQLWHNALHIASGEIV